MAENAIETVQQFLQDVLAPDVRELKVELKAFKENVDLRFEALEQKMEMRFGIVDQKVEALEQKLDLRFDAITQRMDLQHRILLATMSESRAQAELSNLTFKSDLNERMAVLEAKHL